MNEQTEKEREKEKTNEQMHKIETDDVQNETEEGDGQTV